uniref:Uncharacterized protein n=1 Tax=Oryctolagus cuniculus TaxID=9986 RepID=A0A5F9DIV8_RABIT
MLRDSGSAEVGRAPAGPGGAILAGGDVGRRAGHARTGFRRVPPNAPDGPARRAAATSPVRPCGEGRGRRGRRPFPLRLALRAGRPRPTRSGAGGCGDSRAACL